MNPFDAAESGEATIRLAQGGQRAGFGVHRSFNLIMSDREARRTCARSKCEGNASAMRMIAVQISVDDFETKVFDDGIGEDVFGDTFDLSLGFGPAKAVKL